VHALIRDIPVDVMLGGAVIGLIVGATQLSSAGDALAAAKTSSTLSVVHADIATSTTDTRVGAVALIIGAGLAAGGVGLFLRHRRDAAYVATDGHVVAFGARF
jgi:hypothetical protein